MKIFTVHKFCFRFYFGWYPSVVIINVMQKQGTTHKMYLWLSKNNGARLSAQGNALFMQLAKYCLDIYV